MEHRPRIKRSIPLPKMSASTTLCTQWVRCGSATCRCKGGSPHGPYAYLFWREHGGLHKRYVRLADVAQARGEVDRQRRAQHAARDLLVAGQARWRAAAQQVKEITP